MSCPSLKRESTGSRGSGAGLTSRSQEGENEGGSRGVGGGRQPVRSFPEGVLGEGTLSWVRPCLSRKSHGPARTISGERRPELRAHCSVISAEASRRRRATGGATRVKGREGKRRGPRRPGAGPPRCAPYRFRVSADPGSRSRPACKALWSRKSPPRRHCPDGELAGHHPCKRGGSRWIAKARSERFWRTGQVPVFFRGRDTEARRRLRGHGRLGERVRKLGVSRGAGTRRRSLARQETWPA